MKWLESLNIETTRPGNRMESSYFEPKML